MQIPSYGNSLFANVLYFAAVWVQMKHYLVHDVDLQPFKTTLACFHAILD